MRHIGIMLVSVLAALIVRSLPAVAELSPEDEKPLIGVAELVETIKTGNPIEGRAFRGIDLINALKQLPSDAEVRIHNSQIRGSLDFSRMSKSLLESVVDPVHTKALKRFHGDDFKAGQMTMRVVTNPIDIVYSTIQDRHGKSIDGTQTYFKGGLRIENTTVSGYVQMLESVLSGRSRFIGSTFERNVEFKRAAFLPLTLPQKSTREITEQTFKEVTFGSRAIFSEAYFDGNSGFRLAVMKDLSDFEGALFVNVGFNNTEFGGEAKFRSARFEGHTAGFEQAVFKGKADFGQTDFSGARFRGTRFEAEAIFSGTKFSDAADFQQAHFGANAKFSSAAFSNGSNFTGSIFTAAVNFSRVQMKGKNNFSRTDFGGNVTFRKSSMRGALNFNGVRFGSRFQTLEMKFLKEVTFQESNFEGPVVLQSTNFTERLRFENTRFASEFQALGTRFSSSVTFVNSQFKDLVNLQQAVFSGPVTFRNSRFAKPLLLRHATFENELSLENPSMPDFSDFRNTRISVFKFDSSARPVAVMGRLDFRQAEVRVLCLRDVTFTAPVDFSDARLGGGHLPSRANNIKQEDFCGRNLASDSAQEVAVKADTDVAQTVLPQASVDYQSVTFEDDVFFTRTQFIGSVKMEQVRSAELADFTGATFEPGGDRPPNSFALWYSEFADLKLSWQQLPTIAAWERQSRLRHQMPGEKPQMESKRDTNEQGSQKDGRQELSVVKTQTQLQRLSDVLGQLERQFRDQGQLDDANAARFHTKRVRLEELRNDAFSDDNINWQLGKLKAWLIAEAEWWVWGVLSGYGTKIWWAIGWATLITILFGVLYTGLSNVARLKPGADDDHDAFRFRQRLFDFPSDILQQPKMALEIQNGYHRIAAAVQQSSAILMKVGTRDVYFEDRRRSKTVGWLVRIEWVLGYYIVAALIYTLSETWPLLNRLLAGVF